MRKFSIGARWAFRYFATSLAMVTILGILGLELAREALLKITISRLQERSSAVSEIISRHSDEPLVVADLIEASIAGSQEWERLAIQLYDYDGALTLQRDFLSPFSLPVDLNWKHQGAKSHSHVLLGNERAEMVAVNPEGFTRISIELEPFKVALSNIQNVLILLTVPALALSALLSWWQARLSLRPISEIAQTARTISSVGGTRWMPTSGTGDELDVLSETLNGMLERIRSGMDRMRRFATQAAHELSTPLSAARTTIEVTLERDRTPEEYRKTLEALLVNAELLSESVHATLDIARSEAGLSADRVVEVNLREVLESVVEFFGPIANEKGISIHPPAPFHAVVHGDRMWLHRMMSGLLDNAIKYSNCGDKIEFEYRRQAGVAELEFRDTGIGISENDRDHIFERFYRGNGHPSASLGLGLPLAMEIARAHSGNIQVESPGKGGSIFRIHLPLASESGGGRA